MVSGVIPSCWWISATLLKLESNGSLNGEALLALRTSILPTPLQAAARLEAHLCNGPTPHILPEDDAQLEKVPVDDPPISTNTDAAFTALYRPLTQVPETFLSPFRKSTFKPCPTSHLHTLGPILS